MMNKKPITSYFVECYKKKIAQSFYSSCFGSFDVDLLLAILVLLPYDSILAFGHTCLFMHKVARGAATKKESVIRQSAIQKIWQILRDEGYLEKLQTLNDKHPFVIAGDFVLSQITIIPFVAKKIDVYIRIFNDEDERPILKSLKEHFNTHLVSESRFIVDNQKVKFGHTTLYISVKDVPLGEALVICLHLIPTHSIVDYIETKFDLTCCMILFDIQSGQIFSNRFWTQVYGIGYLNNPYYCQETGDRLIRFKEDYNFHIPNRDEFNWYIYYNIEDFMDMDHYYEDDYSPYESFDSSYEFDYDTD